MTNKINHNAPNPDIDPSQADEILNSGHNISAKWGGIIGWFAHNHVAANILMLLFIVGGLISVAAMRSETFPSVDPGMIYVSTSYPGATPYEVADSITSRVEDALIGLNGVKRITATASEGYGIVMVELKDFADDAKVYNDVETAVNSLSDFPPEDAERPKIVKAEVTEDVMRVALYGDVPLDTLKYWANHIEDGLRELPEISLVQLSGLLDRQISIEVSEDTLRHYSLTLADISQAVRAFSVDVPAGTIESSSGDVLLRVQQKRYTGKEFADIIVRTHIDGSALRLGDIARIVDGFQDQNLVSEFNGQSAAFITVQRSDSEDTLKISNAARSYFSSLPLPDGLTVDLQEDRSNTLKERMSLMMRNAVLGFALVFFVLLLFLDLKLAFWTSVAIPVSFLGGLMIMNFMGYSLNMVSLFALIVVLGIVVDDAIIVGESIFEAQEKYPDNPHSVMHGVKRVIAPVSVGVTTTIAAFAPLIFSTGTLGQIISVIPIAVIPILIVSLLEAFLILPSHLESHKRWGRGVVARVRARVDDGLQRFIAGTVAPLAAFTLRWRYVTVAAFIAWAIVTFGMLSSGTVRFIFFPQVESDRVEIGLEMPRGTAFNDTARIMRRIETAIMDVRGDLKQQRGKDLVDNYVLYIGENPSASNPGASSSSTMGNHLGKVRIKLISSEERNVSSSEIEILIRKRIGDLPNIEKLSFESSAMEGGADVEVELRHENEDTLARAANALKAELSQINGAEEVADNFEAGKIEYVFDLTPEGLALGLTPAILGQQLRHAYFGLEAQRIQRGGEEVLVYIRYPKAQRNDLSSLKDARIRLNDGREVPLQSVAVIKEGVGYSSINTVDGNLTVSVTADVDKTISTPGTVIAKLSDDILPALQQRYQGLSYSFEGESRDQAEDMASLGRNALLALMLIYILLGAQLRSYLQPIVIMSAIPFGVVGAIWGHFLLGYDFSFISFFGIVALSGVVVNDSVVLMDYFNLQKLAGFSTYQAMMRAVQRRFRPILLTTLTTSLGLLPILLETSMQARFLIPMVISLAVGIVFATFVILLLVPNLVMIIEDLNALTRRGRVVTKRKVRQKLRKARAGSV